MPRVGSFVTHTEKEHVHYDDPPNPIYGIIIDEVDNQWIVEWMNGSVTVEPKGQIVEFKGY